MQPDPAADARRVGMRYALLALTCAALALGVFARFKGLGTWPLAVDEYYIARSVQNVLASGFPMYECGGYYTRGLTFQYGAALLQLLGSTPEFSTRVIAAVASLLALPAVYVLGRRIHGSAVGAVAVALVAVSLWEVEMARFGRMYAPFQAIFLWYLVFFLRYTVDRDHRALWPMLALTVLGAVTWEGGVFLALTNLLPPFLNDPAGALRRNHWYYLAATGLLLIPIAWFVTADLRHAGPEPDLPLDLDSGLIGRTDSAISGTLAPWSTLAQHPAWVLAALPVLAIGWYGVRWAWTFHGRHLVTLGLLGALGAALLHQFAAFATILLLLLLTGLFRWNELLSRAAAPYFGTVLASGIFWVVYGLATSEWHDAQTQTAWLDGNRPLLLLYEFLRFPDFVRDILVPWLYAAPALGLGLAALLGVAIVRVIARGEVTAERTTLAVLVFLVAAAAASDPPRHETRYVFFLFPVAIVIAIATITRVVEAIARHRPWAVAAGALVSMTLFALSEDFRPHHLLTIDSAQANFRYGLTRGEISHLHPRSDTRGAAQWLSRHAAPATDTVINAFPGVDFYFPSFDFTYIDQENQRFAAYACRKGTMERWGNLPLLYTVPALQSHLVHGGRTFLVVDNRGAQTLLPSLEAWRPRVAWKSREGHVNIIILEQPKIVPSASTVRRE